MLLAQRLHLQDGTEQAGKPVGPWLAVIRIEDHVPADGPLRPDSVVYLEDGTWAFRWDLYLVEVPGQWPFRQMKLHGK
jgi:hypothetical protein